MKLELPKEKVFPMPFRFWVIVAVALVILVVNGWHPVLFPLVMFGFWGITASRGTVLRSEDQMMFRYYSVYGISMGSWEEIKPNAAVVALDEQHSVRQTSYGGTMRYQESQECVLHLVNGTHREKVKIAKVSSREELTPYLPILEQEFNLKLVKFSPVVSAKTSARKRNR
tara:strand:+ start:329 stop:838 length:510 start_codon:yes stop_codon:yes gene_type:complete